MATLRLRIKALEIIANPAKPWLCLDVIAEPTTDEWEQITAAHTDGREVYVFRQDATMGVWMPGEAGIYWSDNG